MIQIKRSQLTLRLYVVGMEQLRFSLLQIFQRHFGREPMVII